MIATAINPKPVDDSVVRIGFDGDGTLSNLASRYPNLQKMTQEHVQNALDANATVISIKINLQRRSLEVMDNGDGVSKDEFRESLKRLAKSRKKEGKFGRFGIGVVSAYGKCDHFTFTSCVKGKEEEGYTSWTFDTEKIRNSESQDIVIPPRAEEKLMYWPDPNLVPPIKLRSKDRVQWRTKISVVNIHRDARLSRFDLPLFKSEVISNFGVKMDELGAVVKIRYTDADGEDTKDQNITAQPYSGKELMIYRASDPKAGKVFIRLFVARKVHAKREGQVNISIMGNPFRMNAKVCLAGLDAGQDQMLDEDVLRDLTSGLFEGDIECQNLSLKSERDGFVDNDALFAFCKALEEWHRSVGLKYVMEHENTQGESLRQETGMRAMRYLEDLFKKMDSVRDLVSSHMKMGSIGRGHRLTNGVNGQVMEIAASTQGGTLGKRPLPKIVGTTKRPDSPEGGADKPDHIPSVVEGPRGSSRRQVKGHSVGLRFQYGQLLSFMVFDFDPNTGILTFNVSHKYWVSCEATGKVALSKYQAMIGQMVLVLLPWMESDQYAIQLQVMNDLLGLEVHRIINGEFFFTERNVKLRQLN